MLHHVALLPKRFGTVWAGKVGLAAMRAQVRIQAGAKLEHLAALLARCGGLGLVRGLMGRQVADRLEAFAARVALVRALATVALQMPRHQVFHRKGLKYEKLQESRETYRHCFLI
jgi:hypothetical protein